MKHIFGIMLMIIFFENLLGTVLPQSVISFSIHVVVLLAFIISITLNLINSSIVQRQLIVIVVLTALVFILGTMGTYAPSLQISLISLVLFLKLYFVVFILMNKNTISPIYENLCIFLILLGAILNVLYPSLFSILSGRDADRLMGFQLNPNQLGFSSLWIMSVLYFRNLKYMYYIIPVILILLSGSRSAVLVLVLGIALKQLIGYNKVTHVAIGDIKRIVTGVACLVLIVTSAIIMNQDRIMSSVGNITNTLSSDDGNYVRLLMLLGGMRLALENFPTGAGWGTFGSPFGKSIYVYEEAGIAYARPIYEFTGIFDSGVGTILGELGFIGFVLTAIALKKIGSYIHLNSRQAIVFLIIILISSLFRNIISDYLYAFVLTYPFVRLGKINAQKI